MKNTMFRDKKSQKLLKDFVKYVVTKLGIKKDAKLHLLTTRIPRVNTAGIFNPHTSEITVSFHNRAMADVFRTIAHELTHHHQSELKKVKDNMTKKERLAIEDEANVMSGRFVHEFGEKYPAIYEDIKE